MTNVRSLDDLKAQDSDDDGKHNELYTGGTVSGQVVRGPPRKVEAHDDDDDSEEEDRVGSIFAKARQHGAVQGTSSDLEGPRNAFKGTANTLAGGPSAPQAAPASAPRVCVITFYVNRMFTVDDGPGRGVDDRANDAFIQSIAKGECPEELDTGAAGAAVTVNLVRSDNEYKSPEVQRSAAFQGVGRSLAGASGSASGSAGASGSSAAATAAPQRPSGAWKGIDESAPTTSLQLRLADGTRTVARFNHSHTLDDVRRFLTSSQPGQQAAYQLMTGSPPKLVEAEGSTTLEAAGLLNAVLIQKLC